MELSGQILVDSSKSILYTARNQQVVNAKS